MKKIQVEALDSFPLSCTLFPTTDSRNKFVILNSATGVPRQFYRYYAEMLAHAGYCVITYDYRGINDSRPKTIRGFNASIRDWAFKDMAGLLDWIITNHSPEKIFMVGHSVGGHLVGMLDNAHQLDGLITLCANSGYWRLLARKQRPIICFHSYITMPLLSNLMGYMPWGLFGGMDLPKGVALDWAKWCRNPQYLLGDRRLPTERFTSLQKPVLAMSFDDDPWRTEEAIDAMMRVYPILERRHLRPSDVNIDKIGHLGYFRKSSSSLWQDSIDWLNAI